MYIVINKTKNTKFSYKGNFPNVDEDLNNGDDIIIISHYSNTIKLPILIDYCGENEWTWKDYNF